MKMSHMIPLLVLISQAAFAQVSEVKTLPYCTPWPQVDTLKQKFIYPREVEKLLRSMRADIGERRLEEVIGVPVLRSLDVYSKMEDNQVNANMYVAAAAGGAAAAVVEYVWDRVVGNGPKGDKFIPEDYFDVTPGGIRNPWTPRPPVFPKYQGMHPKMVGVDPVALTPAAVGTAAAGAVAYKAVEYSMKKAFGTMAPPTDFGNEMFDLSN